MQLNTKKIHQELDRLGWSYAELGRAMGKHRQAIWAKLNRPDKGMTLRTVEEFAHALGVDPMELLDGEGKPTKVECVDVPEKGGRND